MTDKVTVLITAVHEDDQGNKETIETKSFGECQVRSGVKYVIYEENPKESGYDSSMIKIDGDRISVVKKNKAENITSKMSFKTGMSEETEYRVMGGALKVCFDTKYIRVFESENETEIAMQYDIIMNGVFAGKNLMKIKIEKIKG